MEYLSNDHEDHPNQQQNSHKLHDEMGHPVLILLKSHLKETETTAWSEFSNGMKTIVEQILVVNHVQK